MTLRRLADFVDQPGKGGAMILIAGPKYMPGAYRNTPLARILPFAVGGVRTPAADEALTEGFVVQPTELGLASPGMQLGDTPEETRAIWRSLPPLYWMIEAGQWKPGVRVLAANPESRGSDGRWPPVIAMQYVGAGKVLFHATDETWRWRRCVGDAFFARYWIQTIRWLARAKLSDGRRSVELSTDRREYRSGDSVRLCAEFADESLAPADDHGVAVVLERQGRKTQRVQLHRSEGGRGTFEGVFDKAPMGSYHGLDCLADVGRTGGGGRFHRVAAARRSRPSGDGRRRDAASRRGDQGPLLHLRRCGPAIGRPAAGPPRDHRDPAAHSPVELAIWCCCCSSAC